VAPPRFLVVLCGALCGAVCGVPAPALAGAAPAGAPVPPLRWGPYKDVAVQPPADPGALASGATLTLAFATGECGAETIARGPGADPARALVAPLEAAGTDFIVSTGGEMGRFTCARAQGMEDFLAHYRSPRLVGVDFDIEGERSAAELDALMRSIAAVQPRHPRLRWSFTLPTFAGTDAVRAGLNRLASATLAAARRNGVRDFVVNLMAMDYGEPSPAVCVVRAAGCDMARSAEQAVENLHAGFGVAYGRIAVTLMLGRNDTAGSVTKLEDAEAVARFARGRGLAGLHYWSLDRDRPCAATDLQPHADCSGMPYPPRAYMRGIEAALKAP
jgi:chitinase